MPLSKTALHDSSSLSSFIASVISSNTFTFILCLRPVVEGHMMICEKVGYDRMRMSLYCLLTCVTQVSMRSPMRCRFLAAAARAEAEEMSELALLSGDTDDALTAIAEEVLLPLLKGGLQAAAAVRASPASLYLD